MNIGPPVNGHPRLIKPHVERLTIINLDQGNHLTAQYNPKEIGMDKSATWNESPNSKGNGPELVFGASGARTISLELFFDTYERNKDVHELYVKHLLHLLDVIDVGGTEDEKRPPRVQLDWGGKMPKFIGVVASVSTKYTMWLPDGTPVRATCSVKFTEAARFGKKKK